MQAIINNFNERSNEVRDYVILISKLENLGLKQNPIFLTYPEKTDTGDFINKEYSLPISTIQSLKATVYVMLYNLIESTMHNLVMEIYNILETEKVHYDQLNDKIKKIIQINLKNCERSREYKIRELLDKWLNVALYSIKGVRDKKGNVEYSMFNGNVDVRQIKDIASKFWFSSKTKHGKKTKDYEKYFLEIKTSRNQLAHWNVSFSKRWESSDFVGEKAIEIADITILYIDSLINNVAEYLKNKKYLKK